eukprot:CAMPEP_0119305514 /NCGR_PEP_ID=MMETSP1333-20130426/6504_1 /TAXON_ID=418940 /ORGANISM="Scyphosphaera apsteinii, Strain RCC1455" /LENGTH=60 /DNA_ID=CAMNT_0007308629 /DNA_START=121 /DNA_END=300 /DNA_ORIENTATION=-
MLAERQPSPSGQNSAREMGLHRPAPERPDEEPPSVGVARSGYASESGEWRHATERAAASS